MELNTSKLTNSSLYDNSQLGSTSLSNSLTGPLDAAAYDLKEVRSLATSKKSREISADFATHIQTIKQSNKSRDFTSIRKRF